MGEEKNAQKMKELRLQTGMKQQEFAEYFEIPYATYQKWEQGIREYPPYVYKMMKTILEARQLIH